MAWEGILKDSNDLSSTILHTQIENALSENPTFVSNTTYILDLMLSLLEKSKRTKPLGDFDWKRYVAVQRALDNAIDEISNIGIEEEEEEAQSVI